MNDVVYIKVLVYKLLREPEQHQELIGKRRQDLMWVAVVPKGKGEETFSYSTLEALLRYHIQYARLPSDRDSASTILRDFQGSLPCACC